MKNRAGGSVVAIGAQFGGALLAVLLQGCVGTVRVHESARGEEVKGIPFFAKVGYCVSSETWERRWLEVDLTLALEVEGKAELVKQYPLLHIEPGTVELKELAKAVADYEKLGSIAAVEAAFQKVESEADIQVDPESPRGTGDALVSKVRSVVPRADYEHVYYLNGRMPWFGSSSVGAELAPDGTLSKGNAQSDSAAAEVLLGFFPFKEFLTTRWVPSDPGALAQSKAGALKGFPKDLPKSMIDIAVAAAAEEMKRETAPRVFKLEISSAGYRFVEVSEWRVGQGEGLARSCQGDLKGAMKAWTRTALGSESSSEGGGSKDITFKGAVTLPKAAAKSE